MVAISTQINIENAENIIAAAVALSGGGAHNASVWLADVSDQTAPPIDMGIEWNNITQSSATELFIDDNDKNGVDLTAFLNQVTVGSQIRLQLANNPAVVQVFEVTSTTDNTTYFTFGVTLEYSTGGNIADGEDVAITFISPADVPDHGIEHLSDGDDPIPSATTSVGGSMSAADKTKLDGIESGATADQTDSEIETGYNNQVAVVTQVDAEAGTDTTVTRWTAERVGQAVVAIAAASILEIIEIVGPNNSSIWFADVSDQTAPPADKSIEWNNTTQSSATELFIDNEDSDGVDLSSFFNQLEIGSRIRLQPINDITASQVFRVASITDNTTFFTFGVTNVSASGANISDSQEILITFIDKDDLPDHGIEHLSDGSDPIPSATTSVGGLLSSADKTKLDGIETGATADQSDSEIETAYNNQVSVVSQAEAEAGTSTTVRRWTAERVAQAIAALETGGGGGGGTDFIFAYDTSTQVIVTANTFQDVTFSTNGPLNGWTHTGGSALFTCPVTGVYECKIELSVDSGSNGNTEINMKALFNGVEIAGSHRGVDVVHKNSAFPLDRNFMFNGTASQDLKIQWAAEDDNNNNIQPGPTAGSVVTAISGTITIRRIS